MEDDVVIKVDNVSKKFTRSIKRSMLYGSNDLLKGILGKRPKTGSLRKGEFWSLKDISFQLKKGEALGIIGQNGSGKTTLLRILNGIFPPDKGMISVKGKIGALIAVGAGFHPHMSGRENIYLNGIILGMTKQEIDEKFSEIIEFADIGDFLDAPVSTYSSGMSVRLGFAIAIHCVREILLADEVIAVGDLAFQLKCYKKIAEYKESGGSIILVSHGMQLIRNTCDTALWLDKGIVKAYGDVQPICDEFERFMFSKASEVAEGLGTKINKDPLTRIKTVEFLDSNNNVAKEFRSGDKFTMRIHFQCDRKVDKPIFTFGFLNPENVTVISNYTNYDLESPLKSIQGEGFLDFQIDSLAIKPGIYNCTVTLTDDKLTNILDWHEKVYNFQVVEGRTNPAFGIFQPKGKWVLNN